MNTRAIPFRNDPLAWLQAATAAAFAALGRQLAAEGERCWLWLVAALGAGIAVYFALPFEPSPWVASVCAATAVVAWLTLRRRDTIAGTCVLFAAAFAVGLAAATIRAAVMDAPILSERIGGAVIEGRVLQVEPGAPRDGRTLGPRVVLDQLAIAGLPRAPERIRLRLRPSAEGTLKPGQRVALRANLMAPPSPAAPGSYDFGRQAYFQGIGGVGFALGNVRVVDASSRGGTFGAIGLWIESLHTALDQRIRGAVAGPAGAMASALLTGEHGAIPSNINDEMRDSGLAHLLAISGMNLSLVIGFLFVGTRAALALIPWIALRYPIKKWAVVPALVGGAFYLLVTGATVPTQRAFVMGTFVLVAVALDRTAISMRLVAIAATAVLLLAPESLLGPSFQMSFAAVVALLAAHEAWGARFARWRREGGTLRTIAYYLGNVLGATTIAGLATAPIAIYHFNRFALLSVPANMLAEPLTSLWIMPWGTLAYLLMPLGIERLALIPMGWGLDALAWIAHFFASLPGAVSVVPTMPTWGLAVAALGGLWIAFWTGRWRMWGFAGLAVALISVAVEPLPDILIAPDGDLVGVRGVDGGLAVAGSGKRGFIADTWARRLGEDSPVAGSDSVDGLSCVRDDCVLRTRGITIALPRTYPALFQACRYANAVVTPLRLGRTQCPASVVIGREDLRARGAWAIWMTAGGLVAQSVRDWQGDRPWSVGMGTVARARDGARDGAGR